MLPISIMKSMAYSERVERYATKTERHAIKAERYATAGGTLCHCRKPH